MYRDKILMALFDIIGVSIIGYIVGLVLVGMNMDISPYYVILVSVVYRINIILKEW